LQWVAFTIETRKNFLMDQKTRSEIESALKHARLVVANLEAMLPSALEVPEEIRELVAKRQAEGICLSCLLVIPVNEKPRRGNHVACYATQRARIRAGTETEDNLVMTGKLTAESRKPGRRAALDAAAEVIAKSIAEDINNTKPKKVADKKSGYRKDS
jgi:hypothetical protein